MTSKFAARYVAIFQDGSTAPVKIVGYFGKANLIGLVVRGDGYRRVMLLSADEPDPLIQSDPWIKEIQRIPNLTVVE